MIYEYAVEPELFVNYHDVEKFFAFCNKFGFGKGRIISDYPTNWVEDVWEKLDSLKWYCENDDIMQKTLMEIFYLSTDILIHRPNCQYDSNKNWLDNCVREHNNSEFHAIVSQNKPKQLRSYNYTASKFLTSNSIGYRKNYSIKRNADDMCKLLTPIFRTAREMKFYDPHFSPEWEYLTSFNKFFEEVAKQSSWPEIEIHTAITSRISSYKGKSALELKNNGCFMAKCDEFHKYCLEKFPDVIPENKIVNIQLWIDPQRKFHDRCLYTDIGCIGLTNGFSHIKNKNIDIFLNDRETIEQKYYLPKPDPACEFDRNIVVIGNDVKKKQIARD